LIRWHVPSASAKTLSLDWQQQGSTFKSSMCSAVPLPNGLLLFLRLSPADFKKPNAFRKGVATSIAE